VSVVPDDPKTLLRRGLVLCLLGFLLIASGVGLAIGFPCKGWCTTPLGAVGMALAFLGLVPVFYGRILLARAARTETEGPPTPAGSTTPSPPGTEDETVQWLPNPFRDERVARERTLRRIAILSLLVFVVATALLAAGFAGLLSGPQWVVNFVVGFWFVAMFLFVFGLAFSKRRSYLAPIRVGLSARGIHAEYDTATEKKRIRVVWIADFMPWDQIGGLNVWAGWGPPHGVQLLRKSGGSWSLDQVTPEIVSAIQKRWDEGATRPLATSTPSTSPIRSAASTGVLPAASGATEWVPNDLSDYYRRMRRNSYVFFAIVDIVAGEIFGSLLDTTSFHLPVLQPWEFGLVMAIPLFGLSLILASTTGPQRMTQYSAPVRLRLQGSGLLAEMRPLEASTGATREVSVTWPEVVGISTGHGKVRVIRYTRGDAQPGLAASKSAGWNPGASVLILAEAPGRTVEEAWNAWKARSSGISPQE
jgi:hypothetical protein